MFKLVYMYMLGCGKCGTMGEVVPNIFLEVVAHSGREAEDRTR